MHAKLYLSIFIAYIFTNIQAGHCQNQASNNNSSSILSVVAYDDTANTVENQSIKIDVLKNDFEKTNNTMFEEMIIGNWEMKYKSGGVLDFPPFPIDSILNSTLNFTSDSLFAEGFFLQNAFSYQLDPSIEGFILIDLQPYISSSYSTIIVKELSDSILSCSGTYNGQYFVFQFVPKDDLTLSLIEQPENGSAFITADNQIEYLSYYGSEDSITYTTCNNLGMCDTARVYINRPHTIEVLRVVSNNDLDSTEDNINIVIDVLCNDYKITSYTEPIDLLYGKWDLQAFGGGWSGGGPFPDICTEEFNTTLEFTKDSIFGSGQLGSFDFYIEDSYSHNEAENQIEIDFTNNVDYFFSQSFFSILTLNHSTLKIAQSYCCDFEEYYFSPDDDLSLHIIENGIFGNATISGDNRIIYNPDSQIDGIDTIVYKACSTNNICDTAVLIVEVQGASNTNSPPLAFDDFFIFLDSASISFNPLENDFDAENNIETIGFVNAFGCGTITFDSLSQLFTVGFSNEEACTFDYVVCDSENLCDTATVTIQNNFFTFLPENSSNTTHLFPNPAKDVVFINSNN